MRRPDAVERYACARLCRAAGHPAVEIVARPGVTEKCCATQVVYVGCEGMGLLEEVTFAARPVERET